MTGLLAITIPPADMDAHLIQIGSALASPVRLLADRSRWAASDAGDSERELARLRAEAAASIQANEERRISCNAVRVRGSWFLR